MEATLKAAARDGLGKGPSRRLRVTGHIPASVYGTGKDPLMVEVRAKELVDILMSKKGVNTLITLDIDGKDAENVIVREHQIHPVKRTLLHCDFMRIDETRPVEVTVPLVTVGKSAAEKAGGKIRIVSRQMKVRCLPKDIPSQVEYDVTPHDTTKTVYANEVKLPEGVSPGWRHNFAIFVVTAPKVVETPAEAAKAPAKKGKK